MARLRIGIINWLDQKVSVMLVITLACVVLEFLFFKIKISKSRPVRALERKNPPRQLRSNEHRYLAINSNLIYF